MARVLMKRGLIVAALLGTAGRSARHPGYTLSRRVRKSIGQAFGWIEPSAT